MEYLYRAFDNTGALLYVGISSRWHYRLHQHEKTSDWIERADYVQISRFPDRESVERAEKEAIRSEKPQFNKVFSEDYEAAPSHWLKLKQWIRSGKAPDKTHQFIVDNIRESALLDYKVKPSELRPKMMAFLFLQQIEIAVYHGFEPCRNCGGVWNSSIIQPGYEGGEDMLLEVGAKNGTN